MEETVLTDKKFCECGCGELIPIINKTTGIARRFKHGHNHAILDRSLYVCYACGTRKTSYSLRNGMPHYRWHRNDPTDLVLCNTCGNRILMLKKVYQHEYYKRYILYKDRFIRLPFPARKNICEWCGRTGMTNLHHTEYDDNNPLAHTIELCVSCHNKESRRLGQTNKWIDMSDRICIQCGAKSSPRRVWHRKDKGFLCNRCYMGNWYQVKRGIRTS